MHFDRQNAVAEVTRLRVANDHAIDRDETQTPRGGSQRSPVDASGIQQPRNRGGL